MAELIGEHWEGDVRVRWWGDRVTNEVTVERWQDNSAVLDMVAAVNAEGAPNVDGLGRAVIELPTVAAMEYCQKRGIPWEKFIYSNEYDAEFKRLAADHSRLTYENHRAVKSA